MNFLMPSLSTRKKNTQWIYGSLRRITIVWNQWLGLVGEKIKLNWLLLLGNHRRHLHIYQMEIVKKFCHFEIRTFGGYGHKVKQLYFNIKIKLKLIFFSFKKYFSRALSNHISHAHYHWFLFFFFYLQNTPQIMFKVYTYATLQSTIDKMYIRSSILYSNMHIYYAVILFVFFIKICSGLVIFHSPGDCSISHDS